MAGWLKTLPHFAPLSDAQARWPRCATLYASQTVTVCTQAVTVCTQAATLFNAQRVKLAQNTESISFAAGEVIQREGDSTWLGLDLANPNPTPGPNPNPNPNPKP